MNSDQKSDTETSCLTVDGAKTKWDETNTRNGCISWKRIKRKREWHEWSEYETERGEERWTVSVAE